MAGVYGLIGRNVPRIAVMMAFRQDTGKSLGLCLLQ